MATVTYRRATRTYKGSLVPAVDRLDLDIADGEFMVLVGPSGSGKSTALRMLAGLEGVDEGSLYIGDVDVTTVSPAARDIAMVFQNYALYPHMTVAQNIGYHLKIARCGKAEIRQKINDAARLLGIEELLDRKPANLSGGQRQRVAMGRAIVREPQVFLLDEPLSNLDAKLRVVTRTMISALQRRLATTTVYVTHDQVEAMTMGDRVAVLDGGTLQQCDTPERLFDEPANVFVAGFIGSPGMNLMTATVGEDGARFGTVHVPLTSAQRATLSGTDVMLGVRPEGFELTSAEDGQPVTVEAVEELGADAYLHVTAELDDGPLTTLVVRAEPRSHIARGTRLGIRPRDGKIHVFDSTTGQRLPQPGGKPARARLGVA
ncbi:MAG: ABC transporter ATP-binding protein [Sciscionella sp.]